MPVSRTRAAALIAAALACVGSAYSQTSCELTDSDCVEQAYPRVCFEAEGTLRQEPCLAWLREIERSQSPDVRSSASAIYGLIAHQVSPGVQPQLTERRVALIHEILEEHPDHPGALLGFAGLTDDPAERAQRLRAAVAADPTNPGVMKFLARALMDADGGRPEAAAVTERAYELAASQQPGDYALHFARDAIFLYGWADLPEQAQRLRRRVTHDFDVPRLTRTAANAETANPEEVARALELLCRELWRNVFGVEPCLAAIAAVERGAADRRAGDAALLHEAAANATAAVYSGEITVE